MKDISKVYKEWCGSDVHTNDCHPVHDSSETIEFAEKWAEVVKNIEHDALLENEAERSELLKAALTEQKEEIRQWLIDEDFEGLAERL